MRFVLQCKCQKNARLRTERNTYRNWNQNNVLSFLVYQNWQRITISYRHIDTLTGDCILSVWTAYCAVSGCGGYCREKYDRALTGDIGAHVSMYVSCPKQYPRYFTEWTTVAQLGEAQGPCPLQNFPKCFRVLKIRHHFLGTVLQSAYCINFSALRGLPARRRPITKL